MVRVYRLMPIQDPKHKIYMLQISNQTLAFFLKLFRKKVNKELKFVTLTTAILELHQKHLIKFASRIESHDK